MRKRGSRAARAWPPREAGAGDGAVTTPPPPLLSVCPSSRGRRAQQEPLQLPSPGPHVAVALCVRVLASCYKDPRQGQPSDLPLATSPPNTVTLGGPEGPAPTYLFWGHNSSYKSPCAILWTDAACKGTPCLSEIQTSLPACVFLAKSGHAAHGAWLGPRPRAPSGAPAKTRTTPRGLRPGALNERGQYWPYSGVGGGPLCPGGAVVGQVCRHP